MSTENRIKYSTINLIEDFTADEINRKWCTDFTYLFLSNHEVRYNCTILDLHDRSVVASITDRRITSNLAIRDTPESIGIPTAHQRWPDFALRSGIAIYIKGIR